MPYKKKKIDDKGGKKNPVYHICDKKMIQTWVLISRLFKIKMGYSRLS